MNLFGLKSKKGYKTNPLPFFNAYEEDIIRNVELVERYLEIGHLYNDQFKWPFFSLIQTVALGYAPMVPWLCQRLTHQVDNQ